jgi:hypothetical protein
MKSCCKNMAPVTFQIARKVSNIYATTSDEVFAGIYADVEKDFAALYRFVNRDDEVGCCRFQRHRVRCIYEIGGAWRDASLRES